MVGFYLGVKWTSKSAFNPYPKVPRIVKRSILSVWDGIVWQAIGGNDKSGLRRCIGVFGFYKWIVSFGVPRVQQRCIQIIDTCYLGSLLHWFVVFFCAVLRCGFQLPVLWVLCTKGAPVWVSAACSLGSLSLGIFIRQLYV
ncbi:Uncharacterized protein Rs2_23678 [Raphanus sativus]|nr:Uncharacterized protein Rs2_23678 [Raphanus sativus]